jgi:hypothetical protein
MKKKTDILPHPDTIPTGIPDQLIQIGWRGKMLAHDRQSLKRLDWINRLWREKWEKLAETLTQDDCENLIRGLVLVERDLVWSGGSVSGAIWVFHVFERRFSPSHIEVANWVLQNRGRNLYLPFGGQSQARNYEGYLTERQVARRRYQDHVDREIEQKEAKERREKKRIKDHLARLEQGKKRAARVKKFNVELASISISERLSIIIGSDMPLEAISKDSLASIPNAAASIDAEIKLKLIQMIDRRNRGVWGRIKRACVGEIQK